MDVDGNEKCEAKVKELFKGKVTLTPEENIEVYIKWAEDYESDLLGAGYIGHQLCATHFHKYADSFGLKKECKILDVACGTGLVGEELTKLSFTNIDGVDVSQAMLDKCQQKGVYKSLTQAAVGNGSSLPMAPGSYDAVTVCGGVTCLQVDGLVDVVRMVRGGGLLVIVMDAQFLSAAKDAWLPETLGRLCEAGKLREVLRCKPGRYYAERESAVMVYGVQQ